MLNSTHTHTHLENRSKKNGDKDGKALYKLMNNAVCRKTVEHKRNGINVSM